MVNEAGGIKSLGGAKLNFILSDVQSDTTVTRTETDRLISGNKLAAIYGCYATALTLIASEVAERAKVAIITGSSRICSTKAALIHSRLSPAPRNSPKRNCKWPKLVTEKPKVAVVFDNTVSAPRPQMA